MSITYTIRFKRGAKTVGWRCTCGQSLGNQAQQDATTTAQAHSDWHWDLGQRVIVELGGLLDGVR